MPYQTAKPYVDFISGFKYGVSGGGEGGAYALAKDALTFTGGSLNGTKGTFDGQANVVKFTYQTIALTCTGPK